MEPTIVEREDQPYVALRGKVGMNEIGAFAGRTPGAVQLARRPHH